MFTGIIQATAPIILIEKKNFFRTYHIRFPRKLLSDLIIGASISNNGCCLTITDINDDIVSFDLIEETLNLTNLSQLKVGDKVNLERAASLKAEISGHIMSGHIICTAEIIKIFTSENNRKIFFSLSNKEFMKYIFYKGYIGIDGISLTVGEVLDDSFCINLIPETLFRTTIGDKKLSDNVNIEVDSQIQAIVNTVERILKNPNKDK